MPVKIIGLNWQGGKFTHALDIINIPQRPGVYKVHFQEDNGDWSVILVGETRNLYETLVSYLTSANIDERVRSRVQAGRCGVSYAVIADADERKAALRSLYDHFSPILNDAKAIPTPATPMAVNPN